MNDLKQNAHKRSSSGRIWRFADERPIADELLQAVDNNLVLAKILTRRGLATWQTAKTFLCPELYTPCDPYDLPDLLQAVNRIKQAIESKEHLTIYGDYDVDGVTGTSVLLTVFRWLGANADFYIPNRQDEGYGLNLKAVSILASRRRTKLIITCDLGISNFAEINFGRSLGVETIVLDHHSLPEILPPAVALVHPKRLSQAHPLFDLPGVGVAYKVCEALLREYGMPEKTVELLDYVTLGMIADLVPLIRENRYLVQTGLKELIGSKKPGIRALLKQVRNSEDTDLVGFGLAPRINAVGRLSDANLAVELLTTSDETVASTIARQLQTENEKRQVLCNQILNEAIKVIEEKIDLTRDKAIAIYNHGWHHGVVGIVASRLVEKYARPVFIAEHDLETSTVKGSARSIHLVDLYEVLKANEELLVKWGGHKMAAGFATTLDKADLLCKAIVETCNRLLPGEIYKNDLEIDAVVKATEVDLNLPKLLAQIGPFGMSNKKPNLVLKNLHCVSTRALGKEGKHLAVNFMDVDSQSTFEGVIWNYGENLLKAGTIGDIAFTAEINSFNNRDRLQLHILDWIGFGQVAKYDVPLLAESVNIKGKTTSNLPNDLLKTDNLVSINNVASINKEILWRDLRNHAGSAELLNKAVSRFAGNLAVFSESTSGASVDLALNDRLTISPVGHLFFWQFPASQKIFQKLIDAAKPSAIYLVGDGTSQDYNEVDFLKKLLGIIRFTVSKKEGQIQAEKLASLLCSTMLSVSLGMKLLQRLEVIDWYTDDGYLYVDFLGNPSDNAANSLKSLPEYGQLEASLLEAKKFRLWCAQAPFAQIRSAIMSQAALAGQAIQTATGAAQAAPVDDDSFIPHLSSPSISPASVGVLPSN